MTLQYIMMQDTQDMQDTWNEPPHAPVAAHQMAAEELSALSYAL